MSTVILVLNIPAVEDAKLSRLPEDFGIESEFARWLNEHMPLRERGWVDNSNFTGDAYTIAVCTEHGQQVEHMDALARYFFEGPFAGEYDGVECLDEFGGWGRLFLFSVDTTKCRHDDLGDGLEGLWSHFQAGSPIRKTNRAGAGTKGTRAVEGVKCDLWVAFG